MGDKYTLAPLGRVKCAAKTIDEVPSEGIPSEVEIYEPFRDAMLGVEPGDFLYVITIFHLADASVHQGSEGTEHAPGASQNTAGSSGGRHGPCSRSRAT